MEALIEYTVPGIAGVQRSGPHQVGLDLEEHLRDLQRPGVQVLRVVPASSGGVSMLEKVTEALAAEQQENRRLREQLILSQARIEHLTGQLALGALHARES